MRNEQGMALLLFENKERDVVSIHEEVLVVSDVQFVEEVLFVFFRRSVIFVSDDRKARVGSQDKENNQKEQRGEAKSGKQCH